MMKIKKLKYSNLGAFLKEHNGKQVSHNLGVLYKYYECDNNMLVVEIEKLNMATVYFDRNAVYAEDKKTAKWKMFNPLQGKQEIIKHIDDYIESLISELFTRLVLTRTAKLTQTSLMLFDKALKRYGYENALETLYLNLVVFAGEYVREVNGGKWVLEPDLAHPPQIMPVFVDEQDNKYGFAINTLLIKDFHLKGNIRLKRILDFALLPKIFEIAPNPYGQHL